MRVTCVMCKKCAFGGRPLLATQATRRLDSSLWILLRSMFSLLSPADEHLALLAKFFFSLLMRINCNVMTFFFTFEWNQFSKRKA